MRILSSLAALAALFAASSAPAIAAEADGCQAADGGIGVSRIVEIDTANGPLYGNVTHAEKEATFLRPKEVVLTFDDGPMPWITRSILDTLDTFCTKATFFAVGRMAVAYPSTLRNVVARGHTLGSHTWSHPLNLKRLKPDKAVDEIERGFAALSLASGGNVSPFFRFPGLSDSPVMLEALQKRGIAAFSVDVVSDDSFIPSPGRLAKVTIDRVVRHNGGIILFHDIKPATAKALPVILTELKKRGFKVVQMRAKSMLQPLPEMAAELQPLLARKDPPKGQDVQKAAMLPFFGAIGPKTKTELEKEDKGLDVEVLSPAARDRTSPAAASKTGESKSRKERQHQVKRDGSDFSAFQAGASWSPRVRRERLSRTLYD